MIFRVDMKRFLKEYQDRRVANKICQVDWFR